ncbi:unnamed protein product [Pieris brassicae]|uniref:LRRCT domain-containing protein n=1 Tax=Pieris brassicae TaxID=7116 RepID=A0A9P0TZU2_PIEBR|nr:unnamed protein product [Pieris brassicae]
MHLFTCALVFIVYSRRVQSATLCDSDFCVCRVNHSENEDFGETIDCSYNPRILKDNYDLPDTVYSLDLSWNNLTIINSTKIFKSNTLIELLLDKNRITEIESTALQLPKLKKLDLSNNNLNIIDKETFKNINQLEYLNLANNKFHTVSSLSFHHLRGLSEIILDNNDLGMSLKDKNLFDRSGYGLTHKIRSLSISGIGLNTVYDNFFVDAYDIRKLIISNNNISAVFELPITLEYLDLSDNPIREISGEDFSDVPALKVLLLNNLSINEVPEFAFTSLRGLVNLQLERNKNLTDFNVLAFGQDVLEDADDFTLENLSLKGSRLTTLSNKLKVPFGQLVHLDLQGNLWNCDCSFKWIKTLQINDKYSEHLRCYTPRPYFNSKVMDLEQKYFVCTVERHLTGIAIGTISACVLLAFMAAWIYLMVPKHQSRSNFIKNMYSSPGYSLLPVHVNLSDGP